jgi:hypothetical protein
MPREDETLTSFATSQPNEQERSEGGDTSGDAPRRPESAGSHDFRLLFPHPVHHLELAAPTFDLEIVENLAHDASKEPFQVRIFKIGEAADGRFLVGLEELLRDSC